MCIYALINKKMLSNHRFCVWFLGVVCCCRAQPIFYYTGGATTINLDLCPSNICIQCGTGFYNNGCGLDASKINGQNCEPCPGLPDNAVWLPWGPYPAGISRNASVCEWECKSEYTSDGRQCVKIRYEFPLFVDIMQGCGTISTNLDVYVDNVCNLLDQKMNPECEPVALDDIQCMGGICTCSSSRRLLQLSTTLELLIKVDEKIPPVIDWSRAPLWMMKTKMKNTTYSSVQFNMTFIGMHVEYNLTQYKMALMHAFNVTIQSMGVLVQPLVLSSTTIDTLNASNESTSVMVRIDFVSVQSVSIISQIISNPQFQDAFQTFPGWLDSRPLQMNISSVSIFNMTSLDPVVENVVNPWLLEHSVVFEQTSIDFEFDNDAAKLLQELFQEAFHIPIEKINVSLKNIYNRTSVVVVHVDFIDHDIMKNIMNLISDYSLDLLITRSQNASDWENYKKFTNNTTDYNNRTVIVPVIDQSIRFPMQSSTFQFDLEALNLLESLFSDVFQVTAGQINVISNFNDSSARIVVMLKNMSLSSISKVFNIVSKQSLDSLIFGEGNETKWISFHKDYDSMIKCQSFGDCGYCNDKNDWKGCSGIAILDSISSTFVKNYTPPFMTPLYCIHKIIEWEYCVRNTTYNISEYVHFFMTIEKTYTPYDVKQYEMLIASTLEVDTSQVSAGSSNAASRRLLSVTPEIEVFVFTAKKESQIKITRQIMADDFVKNINSKIVTGNTSSVLNPVISVRLTAVVEKNTNTPSNRSTDNVPIIIGSVVGGVVLVVGIIFCFSTSSRKTLSLQDRNSISKIKIQFEPFSWH